MGKLIDLANKRFGFWLVLKKDSSKSNSGQTQWLCQCECGAQKKVTSNSLRTGNSTSCGCNHTVNLVGKKFNNLSVISADYSSGRKYWLCKCDCKKTILVNSKDLVNKIITSCGCKNSIIEENKIGYINKLLHEQYQLLNEQNKLLNEQNKLLNEHNILFLKNISV